MVGRTAALISRVSQDLAVETTVTGWRLASGPTRETRRALSWLGEDLDRCEEVFGSSAGWFKLQLCGPWTLARAVEAPKGGPALRDRGLVAELAGALAQAAADHVADARRRLPGRKVVLQIDEPSLPAVLSGAVGTASGMSRLPAVPPGDAAALLARVRRAADAASILHCCAEFPFATAASAGFDGLSFDLRHTPEPPDPVAAAFEAGTRLVLGAVPTSADPAVPGSADRRWARVVELWRRTGLRPADLARLAFSPACGLAGASPASARDALSAAADLARRAASGEC
jgi:hypothetical protein